MRYLRTTSKWVGYLGILAISLGLGSPASAQTTRKGLTWAKRQHSSVTRTDFVGCDGCDAYSGDTDCSEARPILCIRIDSSPDPGVTPSGFYYGWTGGHIATTLPVQGDALQSLDHVNATCAEYFGPGWRMAEFHDGGGAWNWHAYGDVRADMRFWIYLDDQPSSCWQSAPTEGE
jgi:hypothetical protein